MSYISLHGQRPASSGCAGGDGFDYSCLVGGLQGVIGLGYLTRRERAELGWVGHSQRAIQGEHPGRIYSTPSLYVLATDPRCFEYVVPEVTEAIRAHLLVLRRFSPPSPRSSFLQILHI